MNKAYIQLSLMGRLAYILMCIEAYLVKVHPERDWRVFAKAFWLFPSMDISDWLFLYKELMPDTAFYKGKYSLDVQEYFSLDDYNNLKNQYHSIDKIKLKKIDALLDIPFNVMSEYDCMVSDGDPEHFKNIFDTSNRNIELVQRILSEHHIELPDVHKLDFLAIKNEALVQHFTGGNENSENYKKITCLSVKDENDLWGGQFDGEALSIILNKQ